jgi:hypothetical protein
MLAPYQSKDDDPQWTRSLLLDRLNDAPSPRNQRRIWAIASDADGVKITSYQAQRQGYRPPEAQLRAHPWAREPNPAEAHCMCDENGGSLC